MGENIAPARFFSSRSSRAADYAALLLPDRACPGTSYQGPLPPLTAEERALAARPSRRHIETIAAREHNIAHYDELEKVARYLEATLASYGYTAGRQEYVVGGKTVRNIDAAIEPPRAWPTRRSSSSVRTTTARGRAGRQRQCAAARRPCSNSRGSCGPATARRGKRIRLVLFVNEEPPYFMTADMGSLRYAKALAARNERVTAMFSLETLGYYSDAPGSQKYPLPFGLMFPDTRRFRRVRRADRFAPAGAGDDAVVPLAHAVSDRSAASRRGSFRASAGRITGPSVSTAFQGVMVTDTAPFRYPHYHEPTDTPDKVDTARLARVVKGMERVVRDLVALITASPARRRSSAAARRSWSETSAANP